jgi:hypothetical protein
MYAEGVDVEPMHLAIATMANEAMTVINMAMIRLSIDISPPHRINPMLPNTWAKRSASLPK